MSKKWVQRIDGDPIHIPLTRGKASHRIRCCDCGFVHTLKIWGHKDSITIVPFQEPRATAQSRRTNKYPLLKKWLARIKNQ